MHNGYGHILIHQEEETLTFDQLADQVFKNAQAGQPEAIAAIGEIADAQATLQWLATNWERNKTPLEKTNAQEKISPTAIALSDAHYSGKKYGGNGTLKDYNELEEKKVKYCSESGKMTCKEHNLSETEIRYRAHIAEQCALARSTINNKCFTGGDGNHRTEEKRYWKVYTKCAEQLLEIKR